MMVEVFGVDVYQADYEAMLQMAHQEWSQMDAEDQEVYDDYEEFEEMYLHSQVWSDD